ncbi:MAG: GTP cyclohydrolase II [Anaerolineae bacterium]|nr:GTP cyclohydrolase II [Anaerolineae bacterium]
MNNIQVEQLNCVRLPTDEGEFQLCLYANNYDQKDHLALVIGNIGHQENVLVRIHSECFTGDVLGSMRCDCGQQLHLAMRYIATEGAGIIIYLRQEGRGIGLANKLRAYELQDQGYDTVEANHILGHQADERDYTIAARILEDLGVRSIRMLTNNPDKIESLQRMGIVVSDRVPLYALVNRENAGYLMTKMKRMRHMLNLDKIVPFLEPTTIKVSNGGYTPDKAVFPMVTLSYAQAVNGSITHSRGEQLQISSTESMMLTHKLRDTHDAILVGIGTLLADDPQLNVRLVRGRDPQPVVLDSHLRFPLSARLLASTGRKPWIMTTNQADPVRHVELERAGAQIFFLPSDAHGRVDLRAVLALLYQKQIESVLVEGGAEIITSFLNEQLVNRAIITIAPIFISGLNAVGAMEYQNGFAVPRLRKIQQRRLGDDMILSGEVVWEDS